MNDNLRAGLVSIVTPVFNGEEHLSRLLDSVLAQTYPQIQMILSDDGSDDRTLELAESYREKFSARGYSFQIVTGPHAFAAGAVNRGLRYVEGEFLIWPDSDDVLEPESVEARVSFLQEHPAYRCVRSLSYYFDARTGERLRRDEKTGDLDKEELFWDILESRTFVCCGCYMLRSQAFFHIYPQRRIPEYPVGQNFQMLLPFMYRHPCPTIPLELYGVYVRPGSHSRSPLDQAQEERKYQYYEDMIDELAAVCGIADQPSLDRLALWKARRRVQISLKYGRKEAAAQAQRLIDRLTGGEKPLKPAPASNPPPKSPAPPQPAALPQKPWHLLLKDAAWKLVERNWLGTWLYPRWRRFWDSLHKRG